MAGYEVNCVNPQQGNEHTHTIIFLQDCKDRPLKFIKEILGQKSSDGQTLPQIFPSFKWVFPPSKLQKSARHETQMSQWFDIWSVEKPELRKELQLEGLRESIAYILEVIHQEVNYVDPERIILCGISQGCATAILALLYGRIRLGGFIGISGWLPLQKEIKNIATYTSQMPEVRQKLIQSLFVRHNEMGYSAGILDLKGLTHSHHIDSVFCTPVFLSHSKDDDVVPFQNGRRLCQSLKHLGMTVTWKEYEDGGHWINERTGVDDLVEFIQNSVERLGRTDLDEYATLAPAPVVNSKKCWVGRCMCGEQEIDLGLGITCTY